MPTTSLRCSLLALSLLPTFACVADPPLPMNGADGQSAVVTAEPAGANCASGGLKVQVGTQAPAYVCNGTSGSDAGAGLTVVTEPPGANCLRGGVRLTSGTEAPVFVCNGTDGSGGAVVTSEPPGVNCPTGGARVQAGSGAPTFVCNGAVGSPGDAGPAGENVVVTTEAPGANCPGGGVRLQVGQGPARFVCNGLQGDAGAPGQRSLVTLSIEFAGRNCEVGGVRVDTGLDANGNGTLEAGEVSATRYVCDGVGVGTGFVLTGLVDPATVFNAIDRTYRYQKCTNSIWNRQADVIVSGQSCDSSAGVRNGYWAHAPDASYPAAPDNDLTRPYSRLVQIPATDTVVFTVGANDPSSRGAGDSTVPNIRVGTISRTTGLITNVQPAVFSDGYTGSCPLLSSTRTQLLCFDGATTIRFYRTTPGSPTLAPTGTVTLPQMLPVTARCPINAGQWCMGGTFAFDGAYFYFAEFQGGNANKSYLVYSATGAPLGVRTATGPGNINGTYFDWSVGRYSTHDVFGVRIGGTTFGTSGSAHAFGPVSGNHTLY
ncbi:MAG: hypothetical protein SFW67_24015 [Myxococcaceae bacterium]|nr:hypothetical protein [Myxococcaceae bacterium]